MISDAAESNLASFKPDMAGEIDTPFDITFEPFACYTGPIPKDRTQFLALCNRLLAAGMAELPEQSAAPLRGAVDEVLSLVAGDENRTLALRATCYRRLFGTEPRSLEQIGDAFGCTRARVGQIYREIQDRHEGIKGTADKSEEAREGCRTRQLGKRKARAPWRLAGIWRNVNEAGV